MASTTPNIGLTLPTGAEKVSRQIINANNIIIDSKMGAVPGGQNLQGEIDALNGNLSTFLAVETFTDNNPGTFNANTSKSIEYTTTKTGYTRIAIAGFSGSGNSGLTIQEYYATTNGFMVYYRNDTSSNITPNNLNIRVLFFKNV